MLYACSARAACFAETFGDKRLVEPADGARMIFELRAARPLRLLELDRGETLMSYGLDARVCVTKPYRQTQRWSRAFHDWLPDLDGLRYIPRHATGETSFCLYLDRCGSDLEAVAEGTLAERLDLVWEAVARYPLVSLL